MARIDSASSVSPQPTGVPSQVQAPPIAQQPSPIALTSMPECPSLRLAVPAVLSIELSFRQICCWQGECDYGIV
jgi:hypothetical protein